MSATIMAGRSVYYVNLRMRHPLYAIVAAFIDY